MVFSKMLTRFLKVSQQKWVWLVGVCGEVVFAKSCVSLTILMKLLYLSTYYVFSAKMSIVCYYITNEYVGTTLNRRYFLLLLF